MIMHKFLFYPIWNLNKPEKFLQNMEHNGLRLERVVFRYFFVFKRCKPRDVHYFLSFSGMKLYDILELEHQLRRDLLAVPVASEWSVSLRVFRLPNSKVDLRLYDMSRKRYLQKILLHRGLLCLFFLATMCVVWAQSAQIFGLFGVLTILVFVGMTMNIYGIVKLENQKNV